MSSCLSRVGNTMLPRAIDAKKAAMVFGAFAFAYAGYNVYQAYQGYSDQNKELVFIDLPKQKMISSAEIENAQNHLQQIVITASGDIVRPMRKDVSMSRIIIDKNGMVVPRL